MSRPERGAPAPSEVVAGPLPEALLHEFEALDLSPYEARLLLALMQLGAANSSQLARHSGVPRTSTYQVMEELNRKGLAQRLSVDGPAMWASPGRDEVLDRLDTAQEERLRRHLARTARVRDMLAETLPEAPSAAGPYVHVIQGAEQVMGMYNRLLAEAQSSVLVLNRPPYSNAPEKVNPVVTDSASRGVLIRVLYQAEQWHDPQAAPFRNTMAAYHRAGVKGAVVDDELPMKLALVDARVALLTLTDPVLPDIGFPTTMLVEHPGFAAFQVDAFEHWWAAAVPVVDEAPGDGAIGNSDVNAGGPAASAG